MKDSQVSDRKLDSILEDAYKDRLFGAEEVRLLAQTLKNERADRAGNPGVWDGAPETANECSVYYSQKKGKISDTIFCISYRRELPKTKAREIAERAAKKYYGGPGECADLLADDIEAAILEAQKDGE